MHDNFDEQVNNNILVVGSRPSSISRIVRSNCSYVITDPGGVMYNALHEQLEDIGCKVKVLDAASFSGEEHYNPFRYVKNDEDVITLVDTIMKNTGMPNNQNDAYFTRGEVSLLTAVIAYMLHYIHEDGRTLSNLVSLLVLSHMDEEGCYYQSDLDMLFNKIDVDSFPYKQYRIFAMSSFKTQRNLILSCAARVSLFNMEGVARLTDTDTLQLSSLADQPTAIFITVQKGKNKYDLINAMLYGQLMDQAYVRSENLKKPACEICFVLKNFREVGKINHFEFNFDSLSKVGISNVLFVRSLSELKEMYPDGWETFVYNSGLVLCVNGCDAASLEYFSKVTGNKLENQSNIDIEA